MGSISPRRILPRVALEPAVQSRYRDTALADARSIMRHTALVVVLDALIVAASELAAFVTWGDTGKAILAFLASGVGGLIGIYILTLLGALGAAPHRQRKQARQDLVEAKSAAAATLAAAERDLARERTPHGLLEAEAAWIAQTIRRVLAGHELPAGYGVPWERIYSDLGRLYVELRDAGYVSLADGLLFDDRRPDAAGAPDSYLRHRLVELERVLERLREDG